MIRQTQHARMIDVVLSILMLASFAMLGGAVLLWRKGVRKQAVLMVVLAVIAAVNVAIWTIPVAGGSAPLDQVEAERSK